MCPHPARPHERERAGTTEHFTQRDAQVLDVSDAETQDFNNNTALIPLSVRLMYKNKEMKCHVVLDHFKAQDIHAWQKLDKKRTIKSNPASKPLYIF